MSDDPAAGAKAYWDKAYQTDHKDQESIANHYTLASPLYWKLEGNRRFGNTGWEYGWQGWLKRVYGTPRRKRLLELGSGTGDLMMAFRKLELAEAYTGVEISDAALQAAREKARAKGYDELRFVTGDLNGLDLAPASYDLIVAQMCIHHVENLEGLFEVVRRALSPGGVFAINEYVGPTLWQFTDRQLLLVNSLLARLPERLRVCPSDGNRKPPVGRPTPEQMRALDPSESIRSGEIEAVFRRYFRVDHRIDYGGAVAVLLFDNIASNFREDDPQSLRWFKLGLAIDRWAHRLRLVPPFNVALAGRPL